jgi:hypothetical protein
MPRPQATAERRRWVAPPGRGTTHRVEHSPSVARAHLERSVELRRALGWSAGTAAALLALAEYEATRADATTAAQHLSEARALAVGAEAQGVIAWIDEVENA